MKNATVPDPVEEWIARWRRRPGGSDAEADIEPDLRRETEALVGAGLDPDEAFLVALRRLGRDEGSRRMARDLLGEAEAQEADGEAATRRELLAALALGFAATLAVKLPELFGLGSLAEAPGLHLRILPIVVLGLFAGYFGWKRGLPGRERLWLGIPFVGALALAGLLPFRPEGSTAILAALHLPIALWIVVGVAHAGLKWRDTPRRMDFVRFSGEFFVYYVLIALGGGVLTGLTLATFRAIGLDAEGFVQNWLLPCGAAGAAPVAAWLAETHRRAAANLAPLLARVFAPLFALFLLAFLGAMAWTGRGVSVEREVLIAFDLLLVVVTGLALYAVASRNPEAPPGVFDRVLAVLVTSALIADGVALAAMAGRLSEFGLTPNRVAALGVNLVLLVSLAGSGWFLLRFLTGRGPFLALERWQTRYLAVYAGWAAVVVLVFPPLFRFA